MTKYRDEKGFTLIELLIVIIILGILAAIVVFAVGGITDKGVNAACKADFKSVEVAQEAKFAQTSAYSADIAGLVPVYLKEAPNTDKYVITTTNVAPNAGAVKVGAGAYGNANACPTS